jgi:hypothetical protein
MNMSSIELVHTGESIPLTLFLALWHDMTVEWRPEEPSPMRVSMPLLNTATSLHSLLESPTKVPTGRAYSLDVVCRVVSKRCDTMQATPPFFAANERWLQKLDPKTMKDSASLTVNHAILTEAAHAVWEALTPDARDSAIGEARRVLESDIESGGQIWSILPDAPTANVVYREVASTDSLAAKLVAQIHADEIQPMYRKKPCGPVIQGWPARLQAYFWPSPAQGYQQVSADLDALLVEAKALAMAIAHGWNMAQQQRAVALAVRIFEWGGVKQDPDTVTAESVQRVFEGALANNPASKALMNSGWTKVAAFATAHLESGGEPQVIWDSRVATSIVTRLDQLFSKDVLPSDEVPGIGTVPGRGGTRPRPRSHKWQVGYQRWDAQIAGSALVRQMRDVLNDPSRAYPKMPLPAGADGLWTTRGVEMVLFMDGY